MTVFEEPILSVPEDAGARLRESLGLGPDETPRIAYLPGPGDVYGTFRHWRQGQHDPRVPSVTYSTQFYEFCEAAGCEGILITHSAEGAPTITDGRYSFVNIGHRPGEGAPAYYASRYRYAQACLKALAPFKPHVAVVASDFDWQYLPLVKRAADRLILTVHNTRWAMGAENLSLRQKLANAGYRFAVRSVDAAVCTSHECERQLKALSRADLPSFVAVPQQAEKAVEASTRAGPARKLLFLGRLETNKGVFDLLDAYSALSKAHPDLRLVYAGGGGALEALRAEIERRGLSGAVSAPGHLDKAQVKAAIKEADLLVCPTHSVFNEGLAFVCFEAAVQGAPSVMSTAVPARELLKDGCVVFKADSTEALTAALAGVIEDEGAYRRLSAGALAASAILYDRSRAWGSQLYRAIVAGGGTASA